ncbi:MAG TPA: AMP-binding protein [Patescibacteria group bacterium]|nr:AMP-binding protein [Patescibacteria group bacterium]
MSRTYNVNIPWRNLVEHTLTLGPQVVATYLDLLRHQWMPEQKIRCLLNRRLTRAIRHACREVPFYQNVLSDDAGTTGSDGFAALAGFPIIDRDLLADQQGQFKARHAARYAPRPRRTSGTTGKPIEVLLDRRTRALHAALTLIRMQWAGWKPGDRIAIFNVPLGYFGGGKIDFETPYTLDTAGRMLILNAARLDDQRLRHFGRLLREYRPDILRGFPSTLILLARSMGAEKIKIRPRAIMTGGELVLEWQRRFLESSFGCTVLDFYGMWESVAAAAQCERGGYHLIPECGYVEILRNGRPSGPGEAGELVGTHLRNYSMPLIRYNTHDVVAWTGQLCPCGRATSTLSIIGGRGRDLLVTKTGYCVIQAGLATRFVPSLPVEKLQFYQEKKGEALIRIVRRSGYTPEHTRMLLDELTKEVGDSMVFSWEYVDDIPRGPSGKYQFVISHVQLEL